MVAEHGEEYSMMPMRLIPTDSGGLAEVLVSIDGVEQWRKARWERYEEKTFGTFHVETRPYAVLVPILREGEHLVLDIKGDMWIETYRKPSTP
ncbi:MAG: hypothetical protein WCV82_04385 [Candidatus Paceibacterota bacterium]